MAADLPQRLAAILAADIAGYTRLMELDGAGTVAAWRRARAEAIDHTIEQYRGRIVKLTGDGFLAEFSTVESAVRAALSMQSLLTTMFAAQPTDSRVAFRMGVDIGDIWVDEQDVYGTGVNIAARLEALALPGGLCISDAVYAAVKDKIAARYEDQGQLRVKNVAAPVHTWRVSASATARRPGPGLAGSAVAALFLVAAMAAFVLQLGLPPLATDPSEIEDTGRGADRGGGVRELSEERGMTAVTTVAVQPNSIAVLPFMNIDGTEEMRIFSEGLADDVIDRLTATPPLRVSSRGDSFALGANSSSQEIRNRLRVAYYLEGSVRKSGDMLRVVTQLIDSATGFHIVSRTFDEPIREYLQIQDEITKLIVANLRVALPSVAETPVYVNAETASFDAYLAYRRGMDIIQRPLTQAAIEQALGAFRESLTVDPGYAAAFAGICLTYIAAYDVTKDTGYVGQAEQSCGSALEHNPNLIVVHDALGKLYLRTGRTMDAERAFESALAINPNDVSALTGSADAYLNQGRQIEAEQRYRQAVGLQPGNWRTYNSLGGFLFGNGRYVEAADAYREVVMFDTKNETGWANLAASLMLAGDFADAARAFERALELQPSPQTLMNLGMMHYYLNDFEQARVNFEKAIEVGPQIHSAWSNLGDVLDRSGDSAAAARAFVEAERLARERLAINSLDYRTITDLTWIVAMLDRLDEAQKLIASARELGPMDPYVYYIDALVRLRLGETDAALGSLETAVDMGYSRAMIRAEPHLMNLRDNERFTALVGY